MGSKLITPSVLVAFLVAIFAASIVLAGPTMQSRVVGRLARYYDVPFEISVKDGQVTVKGQVRSYWDVSNVYRIVSHVQGVREILMHVDVDTHVLPNKIVKASIEEDLTTNPAIFEPEKIKVAVDNGLVILTGTVSFRREANMAEDIASWQKGVLSVSNELKVLPTQKAQSDQNLTAVIKDMIQHDFPLEKDAVRVVVHGGRAQLTGEVKSLWDRVSIEKEVKRIQGVKEVDNNIKVSLPVSDS